MTDFKNINILTVVLILIWHIYWHVILQCFFREVNIFFIDWRHRCWKFLQICCRKTSNFNHHEYFWWPHYSHCECVVSYPSIGLTFNVHLKIISKLKAARICFKSESCINEYGHHTILVAINKRNNTNINVVIWFLWIIWQSCDNAIYSNRNDLWERWTHS